jgi:hypothetical protein
LIASVLRKFKLVGVPETATAPNELVALLRLMPAPDANSVRLPAVKLPPLWEMPPAPFSVTGVPGALSTPARSSVPEPAALPMERLLSVPIGSQASSAAVRFRPTMGAPLPPTTVLRVFVKD